MKQVTAAIMLDGDKVLIAKRASGDRLSKKWEFPGGKIEAGESPEECLARELCEELGIEARVGSFFARSIYHYEHGVIELLAYFADWVSGEMFTHFHDDAKWVSIKDVDLYDFAPADVPIKEKLKNYFSCSE
ncbi:MAG: 8-oxo-dGTP diphosphatase MutT [Syntrophomonadaceae bacterium]|jgi:8-oxo-dGTP diphosphatase|nr:8-oxo-dGTP diphosphatase MutT [Syntrophomonadaceae bacterium]